MSRTFLASALLGLAALTSAAPASAQLYGASPFTNEFYSFDPDTFAVLATSNVTVPTLTVTGTNSVAVDPTTGVTYAVVKATAVSGRVLITINPATAVGAVVGNLGDNFASIAISNSGQMFGVTGDGAAAPETLYLIDKATGAKTVATALGNGADGEVIAFNPADGNLYHWSGNGTVVFERISATPPYIITNIPISGTTNGETFGASWDGCRNLFVISNIGSRFQTAEPTGLWGAQVGPASPDDIRGHALIGGNSCNADLATSVSVSSATPVAGSPVTFTITVTNNGPARALNPSLAISVPANVTGATTVGCAQDPAGAPNCTLPGTLFTGASATVTVTGIYTGGTGALTATATTTSSDTAAGNDTGRGVVGPLFTVTPTSGLVTTEGGGTASFTVTLNVASTATVTIPVSSSNPAEGTVAPPSLVFTVGGSLTQPVQVTGRDDPSVDGDIPYTIVLAAATSTDPVFNGADAPDVSATNTDNDSAGISVGPLQGLFTTEFGNSDSFTAVLNSQPQFDVSIALASSDTTEGTVAPASLTFTPANWNVPQTVTLTGVDDLQSDGNVAYAIVTGPSASADPNYNGLNVPDVPATNADDEPAPAIIIATGSTLFTNEDGGIAQFTGRLPSQPTANVTIAVSSSDTTEGTVAPATIVFTPANWNVLQTVTVTGVNDSLDDGDVGYRVVLAPSVSADPAYAGIDPLDINLVNLDNDATISAVPATSPLSLALLALATLLLAAVVPGARARR